MLSLIAVGFLAHPFLVDYDRIRMILTSYFDSDASFVHRQKEVLELVEAVGLQLKVVAQLPLEQLWELCQ